MTIDLGARLKSLRRHFELSQRELAKRSGVTNTTISLIEQDKVSPSVGSLKKVLDGFPMSLAEFFTYEDDAATEDVYYKKTDQPDVGSGDIHYYLVGANRENRQMCMLREVLLPGADTGEELLHHDGEESGVVIQGCVELTVGEECRVLSAGDGYYFDSQTPHRFRNVSDDEVVIVSANTPASF